MLDKLRFGCWVATFILGTGSIVMLILTWLTSRNMAESIQDAAPAVGAAFLAALIYLIGLSLEKLSAERSTLRSIGKSIGTRISQASEGGPETDQ